MILKTLLLPGIKDILFFAIIIINFKSSLTQIKFSTITELIENDQKNTLKSAFLYQNWNFLRFFSYFGTKFTNFGRLNH